MRRYKNQVADRQIDKAIICQLDLPIEIRKLALRKYIECNDLELVVEYIKQLLRSEDKEKILKELKEFKQNATKVQE